MMMDVPAVELQSLSIVLYAKLKYMKNSSSPTTSTLSQMLIDLSGRWTMKSFTVLS